MATTSLTRRLHIDKPLLYAIGILAVVSLFVMYSASTQKIGVVIGHVLRLGIGFTLMIIIAQISPENMKRWAPHVFAAGFMLLVIVLAVGVVRKGAQSWFNFGIVAFQPAEVMKLAVPLLLAWYFSKMELPPKLPQILIALGIVIVPFILVAKQPDLGTAIMILGTGLAVIFLAGMRWATIIILALLLAVGSYFLWDLVWDNLRPYQQLRILTVLGLESDPLGTGYHAIQSTIAVGSGGFFGKGWLNGSQAHLKFLPEPENDFIFAVFSEEFGFLGALLLIAVFLFIIGRGFMIAFYAQDTFNRLMASSLTITFFLYFFVNIGMVIGILPVVGVPLPIISKGGSSIVTLMISFGILMSIQTHRKIMQH